MRSFFFSIFLFSVIVLISFAGCHRSVTKLGTANIRINTFNTKEKSLILSADIEDPMRVLLITATEDSIVLRTSSTDVNVSAPDTVLRKFVKRLYQTVRNPSNPGVGIAAPQVGILKNIIWVQRFDKEGSPFEVYLNPKIRQYTSKTQYCYEGCLSIPERRDTTRDRAYAILLDYDKMDGTHHSEMVEAFTAVIFQHEIDHLNGILYIDHLDQEIQEAEDRMKR